MSAAFPHASVVFGCPIAGEVAPISQCADPTFAQGLLGPGVVIQPEGSILFAPADGRVEFILSTKHALGMETPEGVKFLIHVGLDTNRLEGQGFQLFVQVGSQVRRGDKLLSFDTQVMAEQGCSLATPFVFCSNREGWAMELLRTGPVPAGEDLVRMKPPCLKLSIPYAALDRKPRRFRSFYIPKLTVAPGQSQGQACIFHGRVV